jgi:transitional endoplasmic reticulum ATPase
MMWFDNWSPFKTKKPLPPPVTLPFGFADIGGLSREISKIREMVELPLKYPELFLQLGVDPPGGILFYGPPGCGKTMIARAVAHEAGIPFYSINGPEAIQQHYGESEAYLRRIFEAAQEHPAAIIFLDEIDAIAPNRSSVQGDLEKRVVAQLLALMDGVASRGRVIVIAATNLPDNIDAALRRPGRFDREVEIGPPDELGRFEILRIHTRKMPLHADVDLAAMAHVTHGYLGSDLAALCREAAMNCAREFVPQAGADAGLDHVALPSLVVDSSHFLSARNELNLSTTRQLVSEIPDISLDDVGGLDDVKQQLIQAVEWPLRYRSRFQQSGCKPPQGLLLTGRPGSGKSYIAHAIAGQAGISILAINAAELVSKWVGDTERAVKEVFKKARQVAPAILFFDEIDALLGQRISDSNDGGLQGRIVGQFLIEMDAIEYSNQLVVLGATNRIGLLDSALLRPGRFGVVIDLPMPDEKGRLAILDIAFRGKPKGLDVDLKIVAERTDGMSAAETRNVVERAALVAVSQSIRDLDPGAIVINQDHIETALGYLSATDKNKELLCI